MLFRPHLERLVTLLRRSRPIISDTTITIDLIGDRAMVSAKHPRDTTSRISPAQLAGDRLPFLDAQRRAPTHQPSPQNIPRKGDTLADQILLQLRPVAMTV